jgi:hypothetical protein
MEILDVAWALGEILSLTLLIGGAFLSWMAAVDQEDSNSGNRAPARPAAPSTPAGAGPANPKPG